MIQNILTIAFLSVGTVLLIISVVGTVMFKDFYSKLQVLGLGQTLAFGCFIIGLACYLGWHLVTIKLIVTMACMLAAGPIGTHIVIKVALKHAMNKRKEEEQCQ